MNVHFKEIISYVFEILIQYMTCMFYPSKAYNVSFNNIHSYCAIITTDVLLLVLQKYKCIVTNRFNCNSHFDYHVQQNLSQAFYSLRTIKEILDFNYYVYLYGIFFLIHLRPINRSSLSIIIFWNIISIGFNNLNVKCTACKDVRISVPTKTCQKTN